MSLNSIKSSSHRNDFFSLSLVANRARVGLPSAVTEDSPAHKSTPHSFERDCSIFLFSILFSLRFDSTQKQIAYLSSPSPPSSIPTIRYPSYGAMFDVCHSYELNERTHHLMHQSIKTNVLVFAWPQLNSSIFRTKDVWI